MPLHAALFITQIRQFSCLPRILCRRAEIPQEKCSRQHFEDSFTGCHFPRGSDIIIEVLSVPRFYGSLVLREFGSRSDKWFSGIRDISVKEIPGLRDPFWIMTR